MTSVSTDPDASLLPLEALDEHPERAMRMIHFEHPQRPGSGQEACGSLIDFVNESRFRHRGQGEFVESLRGAIAKPLGDGWAYSRSRSRSDVSPLIAGACALRVADMELDLAGANELIIH